MGSLVSKLAVFTAAEYHRWEVPAHRAAARMLNSAAAILCRNYPGKKPNRFWITVSRNHRASRKMLIHGHFVGLIIRQLCHPVDRVSRNQCKCPLKNRSWWKYQNNFGKSSCRLRREQEFSSRRRKVMNSCKLANQAINRQMLLPFSLGRSHGEKRAVGGERRGFVLFWFSGLLRFPKLKKWSSCSCFFVAKFLLKFSFDS